MGRKRRKLESKSASAGATCCKSHLSGPCSTLESRICSTNSESFLENPHLLQNSGGEFHLHPIHRLPRVLDTASAPRLPYRRRELEPKSTVHWGQRKLLISELEFLSSLDGNVDTCVYMGAAPGSHMPFIAKLFPRIQFILIDPSPFSIEEHNNIKLIKAFATPSLCASCGSGPTTVLVSDIRTADWRVMTEAAVELSVAADMELQKQCCLAMQPAAALLKFRLPYVARESSAYCYLKGTLFLPVWGPQTTTETRLLCKRSDGFTCSAWDVKSYNEQMFYFNTVTRASAFEHDIHIHGLDHCYDCSAEVQVLRTFICRHVLSKRDQELFPNKINIKIAKMIRQVTLACSPSGRRDLTIWRHDSEFKRKFYDVIGDSIGYLEAPEPPSLLLAPSAEDMCMCAWRKRGGTDGTWLAVNEDHLLPDCGVSYRTAPPDQSPYGVGYDIPVGSSVFLWVWALLNELRLKCIHMLSELREFRVNTEEEAQGILLQSQREKEEIIRYFSVHPDQFSKSRLPSSGTRSGTFLSDLDAGMPPTIKEDVFILSSRNGTAYIIWSSLKNGPRISKIVLPTAELHHASLLRGTLEVKCSDEHFSVFDRGLVFRTIIAISGEPTSSYANLAKKSSDEKVASVANAEMLHMYANSQLARFVRLITSIPPQKVICELDVDKTPDESAQKDTVCSSILANCYDGDLIEITNHLHSLDIIRLNGLKFVKVELE